MLTRKQRGILLTTLLVLTLLNTACPFGAKNPLSTVEGVDKVEAKLNQAANALNALAKTNRELYRNNVINLAERKRVASVIGKANTGLDKIVDRVFEIDPNKPDSVSAGKIDVVKLLNTVSKEIGEADFGPPELRAAAQAIIALINEAVDLTNRIQEVRRAGTTD